VISTSSAADCENCRFKLALQFGLLLAVLVCVGLLTWCRILDVTLLALVVGGILAFAGVSGYQASQGISKAKGR